MPAYSPWILLPLDLYLLLDTDRRGRFHWYLGSYKTETLQTENSSLPPSVSKAEVWGPRASLSFHIFIIGMICSINLISRSPGKAWIGKTTTIEWPEAKDQTHWNFGLYLLFSHCLMINRPCEKESVTNSALYKTEFKSKTSGNS